MKDQLARLIWAIVVSFIVIMLAFPLASYLWFPGGLTALAETSGFTGRHLLVWIGLTLLIWFPDLIELIRGRGR